MIDYHVPVLLKECIEALNIIDNGVYVDATFGGGGHTEQLLKINDTITIIGIDQDPDAIEQSEILKKKYGERLIMIKDNFSNLINGLSLKKIKKIDGILFDLGTSSHQFDEGSRGFSFQLEGKLDMRMQQNGEITAHEIINNYDVSQLAKIMREYGEEKKSFAIAKQIEKARKLKPIETTLELADCIAKVIHQKNLTKSQARVFQSFRIYINDEINVLKKALSQAVEVLNPGGRLVVISYHSLEDRVVKNFYREEMKDCICPPSFPVCNCSKVSTLKILTKKPILPSSREVQINSRARSAKLRIAERKEIQ